MKGKFYYFLFLLFFVCTHCFAQDVLTNKSIVDLTKAGLPSSVIINKMTTTRCSFDLSTDALIQLKNSKVSDDVLNAMLDNKSKANQSSSTIDTNSSKFNGPGIYYVNTTNHTYTAITSTLSSGNRSSTGLTGVKFFSDLDNDQSNLRMVNTPIFYFYYGTENAENDKSNKFSRLMHAYMPSKAISDLSPNDFKLIQLTKHNKKRSFQTGEMGAFKGLSNGLDKVAIPFTFDKIGTNLYRITIGSPLRPGEYGFVCISGIPVQGSLQANRNDCEIFDFGVN